MYENDTDILITRLWSYMDLNLDVTATIRNIDNILSDLIKKT